MIRLNLFMIWFLHFLSLLSVVCRCYRQNSSSRIIVVLAYTVSTSFFVSIQYLLIAYSREFCKAFIFITMANNKNDDLQSRRDFFKKAGKSILPVLGIVMLSSFPTIVNAAEKTTSGCNANCESTCETGCYTSCHVACGGSCKGGCINSCSGSCKGSSK